jgi:thioredoxin-like negative regulator of GroEL
MQEVGKDFVLVKINTDHNKAASQKYGIQYLPTIIFLNAKGDVVHQWVGYKSFADVMREVQTAKSKL